jgi:hypothetical protein
MRETTKMIRNRSLELGVFLFLAACSTPSETANTVTTLDPTAPRCLVGEGETSWSDLESGANTTVVHGPQGGWHILGSVRTWNLGDIQELNFIVTDNASGVAVADVEAKVLVPLGDDCNDCSQHIGMYGYLDTDPIADGLVCEYCLDEKTGERDPACVPPELLINAPLTLCFNVVDQNDVAVSCCTETIGAADPQDLECIPD